MKALGTAAVSRQGKILMPKLATAAFGVRTARIPGGAQGEATRPGREPTLTGGSK